MSKLTYIAGVLLLVTAVTAQTTSDPMAIINAAKSNLKAMDQWKDNHKTKINGISDTCWETVSGSKVNLKCIDNIETDPRDSDFAARCAAPADGVKDHRCSNEQVNKVLDTLESKCKAELDAKNADIVAIYTSWQIYSLSEDILCSKDSAGNYCILDTANTNTTNNQCVINQLNLINSWKAPHPDKYTNDSASALRAASADFAKENNINGSNTSSKMSAVTTGTAALTAGVLAVVSLLM
jgi:hypothetical protein